MPGHRGRGAEHRAARVQRDPLRVPVQGNNNGSAFAGLTASGPFYAIAGGIAMLVVRFVPLLAALALAGSLAGKERSRSRRGRFATDTPLFVGLLTA